MKTSIACFILYIIAEISGGFSRGKVSNVGSLNAESGYVLKSEFSRYLNAGYGSAISTTVWLDAIFLYADVLFNDHPGKSLVRKFEAVSEFDTAWAHPLLIASWVVPQLHGYKDVDALPFLENGARRFPSEWRFRVTWAQYVLSSTDLDSSKLRDSASKILIPLSQNRSASIPPYARNLAFTLMHKNGKPEEAMSLLLQTYAQVPDPMVRYQFRGKMGDLLWRNHVPLGADSANFLGGIGALLESKDPTERNTAARILVDLVDSLHRDRALDAARQLAGQYAAYSKK